MRFSNNNINNAVLGAVLLREAQISEKEKTIVPLPLVLNHTEPYFHYMQSELKRSQDSIRNAVSSISSIVNWFWKIKGVSPMSLSFSDFTKENVLEWLNFLMKERGIFASTRNQHLIRIKMFLLYSCNMVSSRIGYYYLQISSLPVLREVTGFKDVLSEEQVAIIICQARAAGGIHAKRNAIMLLCLYEAMLRVSELCRLKIQDLCFRPHKARYQDVDGHIKDKICEVGVLHIKGKGGKLRSVELNTESTSVLKQFLKDIHPNSNPDSPLFYASHDGGIKHISSRTVEKILSDCADSARRNEDPSIPQRVYPHMLRRSKATTMKERGAPLEVISTLLGHSLLETTIKHYAKPSKEQIREGINKVCVVDKVSEKISITEKNQLETLIMQSGLHVN